MRISQVSVLSLFGVFDHVIPINMEDRITIIHGPNGFGKTAILRLIDALFNSHYPAIYAIPFSEFSVTFDDGRVLKLSKYDADDKNEEHPPAKLVFSLIRPGHKAESFEPKRNRKINFPVGMIADLIPELERSGPQQWLHITTGEIFTLEEVLDRFDHVLPTEPSKRPRTEPDWLIHIRESFEIRFIQTQRLFTLSERKPQYRSAAAMKEVVLDYSTELASAIKNKWSEYGALSQSLDRTFPLRLVQEVIPAELSIETLRTQLGDLEKKRDRLTAAGLIGKEEQVDIQVPATVDDRTKSVLAVYVKDVHEKLGTFDAMAAKIDLFNKIINERFKYKRMSISKEQGISFVTFDGSPLSPASLSSGEQHELVLLYDLIFKVKPNSLILIDEPEISLHISWQEEFLKDLQQITSLAFFDVLIATHSPQIIFDRWDLTVDLKGPEENGFRRHHSEATN